jgi:4-amino-4-deoxy-L-arabinose transferase-like glycosyltransferase
LPLHVYYSGKILTDVFSTFFIILTALFFWEGFEMGKTKYKLLFGFFLALSILARYTILWIVLVFPIYLIWKNRSFSFLKDKYLWLSIGLFLITLLPLFVYGVANYGNPLGALIHGASAASYWGGAQPWYFFVQNSFWMFSILPLVFLASLFLIVNKKIRKNSALVFLLLWFFIFFVFTSAMPHKEDRFLLPLVPPFVIVSALFMSNLRKNRNLILVFIMLALIFSLVIQFFYLYDMSYNQTNECFLEANKFLKNTPNNSVVITEESPIVYYYSKTETHFYPSQFSIDSLRYLIDNNYKNRPVYILFTEYDMPLSDLKNWEMRKVLDLNFEIVYRCPENGTSSLIYRY